MKKMFTYMSLLCSALFATAAPQDFIALLKQTSLTIVQTDPALQSVNQAALTACINSLFDTGYAELTNDPNHSTADLTLGVLEKTIATLAVQDKIGAIVTVYLHPLPDLSLRFKGYTQNLSSSVLTPEKTTALNWRASTMAALLDAPNSWGTFYYSNDALSALQANPVNAQQIQNFQTIIAHHPQIRAEGLPDAPTPDLEGVVFKIRDNISGNGTGSFFTITTNIPDQPTENPPATLKFWVLFPYANPLANRAQQKAGAQHAIFIQQFGN